jgi:hypothetical protein
MKDNNKLNELIAKIFKFTGARTIKRKELDNLNSAVETIRECVEEDKLIGYVVIGLSNTGDTVQALAGSEFSIYEMMAQFFKTIMKENSSLGRTILEKLKSNFEETKASKSEDEIDDDDDCDDDKDKDDVKKEIAEEIKNILSKCFDIDPEDLDKK